MDGDFLEGFENKTMSINRHPGKVSRELAEFDDKMIDTIKIILKGYPSDSIPSIFVFIFTLYNCSTCNLF